MNAKNSSPAADTKRAAQILTENIARLAVKPMRLMEVCGTHTMSIFKAGIRQLLPANIELVSGPGCPVCVSANDFLDTAIAYAHLPETIIATFGDMLKIPGTHSSLLNAKTTGADVRVVYSPLDALDLALANGEKRVIFLAVGFETTAPVIAATIQTAQKMGVTNLYFLTAHKTVPPALTALLTKAGKKIDGFLLPGHVCAITGLKDFEFLAADFQTPAVVTGFEPLDILEGIYLLAQEVTQGSAALLNQYSRVVKPAGNQAALSIMREVFRSAAA
ncbi:MAG: hydrogenase formation protein HypD, partial [Sporomusaceae bacterium]|nr:hydrogenase formation protein HypD [Sporomusaceae bacterium]